MQNNLIIFGTDGVRGPYGQGAVTPENFERIGRAFGEALRQHHSLKQPSESGAPQVLLARDTRYSGPLLADALSRGLCASGVDVLDAGVLPTSGAAVLLPLYRAQAAAVISASHNPAQDNGVKFFNADGQKIDDALQNEVQSLLNSAQALKKPPAEEKDRGAIRPCLGAERQFENFFYRTFMGLSLRSWRVVVDGANGAASKIAPRMLRHLGAEVFERACEPDGRNINQNCGATHPEALAQTVRALKADLGFAFDGDADRLVVVDHTGAVQDGDAILYLLTKDRLSTDKEAVAGVVGTAMSNQGLEKSLLALGVPLLRTPVGDKYISQALQHTGWVLGAESSGHILDYSLLKTGDGLLAALLVLRALTRTQESFAFAVRELEKMPQVTENVRLPQEVLKRWAWKNSPEWKYQVDQVERQLNDRGRVLVRASGTEPLIRVMVEAQEAATARACAEALARWLRSNAKSAAGQ